MQRGPRRTSSLRAPLLALALVCSGLLTAVTLASASAASCRPGVPAGERGSCTILVSIVGSASVREGKSKTLKVTIRPATHPAFDLLATTSSGTARAPGDYRALSGRRVRVDANASSASVTVRTVNDSALELPERFTVKLDRTDERLPGGYVVRVQQSAAKAAVTITDDDSSVVSIKNVTVAETGATGLVPLTMTNPAGRFCRLAATTTNDSAIAGRDYLALTGGIFDLVVARDNLGVSILDDDLIESPETFLITLRLMTGSSPECLLGDDLATVTVTSEDRASVISIADATVTEDDATDLTVISMTRPIGRFCTVTVTSANGTALQPADYSGFSGGLFNLAGVASDTLGISVENDVIPEPDETFSIELMLAPSSDDQCRLGDAHAVITIVSNE